MFVSVLTGIGVCRGTGALNAPSWRPGALGVCVAVSSSSVPVRALLPCSTLTLTRLNSYWRVTLSPYVHVALDFAPLHSSRSFSLETCSAAPSCHRRRLSRAMTLICWPAHASRLNSHGRGQSTSIQEENEPILYGCSSAQCSQASLRIASALTMNSSSWGYIAWRALLSVSTHETLNPFASSFQITSALASTSKQVNDSRRRQRTVLHAWRMLLVLFYIASTLTALRWEHLQYLPAPLTAQHWLATGELSVLTYSRLAIPFGLTSATNTKCRPSPGWVCGLDKLLPLHFRCPLDLNIEIN